MCSKKFKARRLTQPKPKPAKSQNKRTKSVTIRHYEIYLFLSFFLSLMLKPQLIRCFLFLVLLPTRSSVIAPGKNQVPPSRSGSSWKHLVLERKRGWHEGELTGTRAPSKSLIAGGLRVPIPVSYEPLLPCHFLWPSSLALRAWLCVIIFAACLVPLVPRP